MSDELFWRFKITTHYTKKLNLRQSTIMSFKIKNRFRWILSKSSVSIEIALSKRKFTAVHRCQTCVKQNNMRDAGRVYVCEIAS